ncbi:hypothetical protein FI667_g2251, partial [Globisporangium splendens]
MTKRAMEMDDTPVWGSRTLPFPSLRQAAQCIMYGAYAPEILFGVKEPSRSRVISSEFLEAHDVECCPEEIARCHGYSFVYGVPVTLDEALRGKCYHSEVEATIAKFLAALKTKGVDLGAPKFHLVVRGDFEFETEVEEYLGEDEDGDEEDEEDGSEDEQNEEEESEQDVGGKNVSHETGKR